MKLKQAWTGIAAAVVLSACAIPQAKFDSEKLGAIKTITVAVPRQHYIAASSSGPVIVPGGGLIAAAIGGAISGGINASTNKQSVTFDELVSAKLGDTHFSRRLVDAIEAELRAEGFVVNEVDFSREDMPKSVFENGGYILKGQPYRGADAILVPVVGQAYFAPGPLSAFRRQVVGQIGIYKGDTLEPVFTRRLFFMTVRDSYSYMTYRGLVDDLPHAIQGLDDAAMSLVPGFVESLRSARQLPPAATATAEAKPQ